MFPRRLARARQATNLVDLVAKATFDRVTSERPNSLFSLELLYNTVPQLLTKHNLLYDGTNEDIIADARKRQLRSDLDLDIRSHLHVSIV